MKIEFTSLRASSVRFEAVRVKGRPRPFSGVTRGAPSCYKTFEFPTPRGTTTATVNNCAVRGGTTRARPVVPTWPLIFVPWQRMGLLI